MLVGTHALIQKSVKFQHLAYAIVDEQQRFGVTQRTVIREKGNNPHLLTMTATPIPRTLALTAYGDHDLSVLLEKPGQRKKIITKVVPPNERRTVDLFIDSQIQSGRQAYVICPRIDEPDPAKINAVQAKSAKAEAALERRGHRRGHGLGARPR